MDFDFDRSPGYLVNHLARLFARQIEQQLKPHGIAVGAFPALLHLWAGDGLTQKELVDRLKIEQPTMAATLTRMERDGLIQRHRDDGDARVQRIRLTDKARQLSDGAVAAALAVNAEALADLTHEEKTQFVALLQRVIATMEAAATRS